MAVKICSINLNGFRAGFKQKIVISRLKNLNFDIIFLQETHLSNLREAKKFSKGWDGKSLWSFGTNKSRGVGVLLSSQLRYKLDNYTYDHAGRLLCIDLNMAGSNIRLLNVYAPNCPVERRQFFNELQNCMITSREIIMGGDFNCIENLELDKMGGNIHKGTDGANILLKLKSDFYLCDVFRTKYPKKKEYSFRQGPIHVRLDRFYISDSLFQWVQKLSHTPCSVSDHYYVDLIFDQFSPDKHNYGPGYWKCNTSVLSDPELIREITYIYENELHAFPFKDGEWWEECKRTFKNIIIKHSRRISVQLKKQIHKLEEDLRMFTKFSYSDPEYFTPYVNQIKNELNDLIMKKYMGSVIRSRVQFVESYEKPNRFFLRTEKKNAKNRIITEIQQNNVTLKDPHQIMTACRDFYADLYTEEPVDQEAINAFLYDVNLPKVPPDLVESCEGPLSFEEAKEAISLMKNNKTPGSDGLPAEFYKQFFPLFGRDFINMINLCYLWESLTPSQRLSLITLLCKNREFHCLLNYWRPISLLNVDYKIVSKSLSLRLKRVLPFIIHTDQTCSVIGRSISDNVHLLRNVFDFVEQKNIRCAFINLDQAKAFDRVSTKYLLQVLQAYGFGPSFIKWIKLLYTDISSAVIVNGHIGDSFLVCRSVRQGCAISPLLYVLSMEPFANRVRQCVNFHGLKIPGCDDEVRVTQYADDTTLICTSVQSIAICLTLCKYFGKASGAKLNLEKTCGIWLGAWRHREDKPFGINWVKNKKMLGVVFGHRSDDMGKYADNWGPVWEKFEKVLNDNSNRYLSLTGKATVANIMACSKIWYLAPVLELPREILNKFDRKLFQFIWGSPSEPIKRNTLIGKVEEGGIGLVSIKLKARALMIMHIVHLIRYTEEYVPKWVHFTVYWIGLHFKKYRPDFASNMKLHCLEYRPTYYNFAKGFFDQFIEKHQFIEIQKLTTKKVYDMLLQDEFITPRIIAKYPEIDFKAAFLAVSNKFIDPEVRGFAYKITHDVLPTNTFLFNYSSQMFSHCTFCGRRYEETISHLFINCASAVNVWVFVQNIFWKMANHRLKITEDLIRFNILDNVLNKAPRHIKNMILQIINLAKYSIWCTRCEVKYEHRHFHDDSALIMFKRRLKQRIRVDFYRYHEKKRLFDITWRYEGVLCTLNSAGELQFRF